VGRNGFERFVDRVQDEPLVLLAIFVIVPFLTVNAVMPPLSEGLHGMVHSDYRNEIRFDGTVDGVPYNGTDPPSSGHFRGDIYIGENTGWVICNGKVRFSGTLVIRDADLDYNIRSNRSVKTPGNTVRLEKDYQHVTLDGTEGEMEGGIPFWYLGFIGSAVGAAAWSAWIIFRRRTQHDRVAAIVLLSFGLVSFYNLSFIGPLYSSVCFAFVAVPVLGIFALTLIRPLKEDMAMMSVDLRRSGLPEVMVMVGIIVLAISGAMVVHSGWGSIDGYQHDPDAAWRNLALGIAGLLIGGADIGFGLGKRLQRTRTPKPRRSRSGPSRRPDDDEKDTANVYGLKDFRPIEVPPPPPPMKVRRRRRTPRPPGS